MAACSRRRRQRLLRVKEPRGLQRVTCPKRRDRHVGACCCKGKKSQDGKQCDFDKTAEVILIKLTIANRATVSQCQTLFLVGVRRFPTPELKTDAWHATEGQIGSPLIPISYRFLTDINAKRGLKSSVHPTSSQRRPSGAHRRERSTDGALKRPSHRT